MAEAGRRQIYLVSVDRMMSRLRTTSLMRSSAKLHHGKGPEKAHDKATETAGTWARAVPRRETGAVTWDFDGCWGGACAAKCAGSFLVPPQCGVILERADGHRRAW